MLEGLVLLTEAAEQAALSRILRNFHPALPWSGRTYTRRRHRDACDIPLDISRDELLCRMRTFGGNHYGISPAINLHGVAFTATSPEST
jgi:hypothetical protein